MKTTPIRILTLFVACTVPVFSAWSSDPGPEPDNDGFSLTASGRPQDWDWLMLDTGEWLKGEIKAMYDDEIEFDSDHFGVIMIDWDDVEKLRTNRRQAVRIVSPNSRSRLIADAETVVGKVTVSGHVVKVTDDEKTLEIDRNRVISMASSRRRELDKWSARVSVGGNLRSGNTESHEFSARASAQRRTASTRFHWDYIGNYSVTDDILTYNNHRTNAYLDFFLSRRFFIRPVSVEYFRDVLRNIDHQETYSVSLGYTIVDQRKLTIDFTGGPSYQRLTFINVPEGTSRREESPGGIVTTVVDWELTSKIDFLGTYRVQWAPKDAGGIISHSDSTFEFEVTDDIDFSISFIWDRISNPVAEDEESSISTDDFTLMFTVGLEL